MRRLDSYSKNLSDYHLITDLVPTIAKVYFARNRDNESEVSSFSISATQATMLLGVGLQYKMVDSISKELDLPFHQGLALFNKVIKKVVNLINR